MAVPASAPPAATPPPGPTPGGTPPTPTPTTATTTAAPTAVDEQRRARLRRARRQATGLLVVVAAAAVTIRLLTDDHSGWVGYAIAALDAAMVGGLADWFAVTALFRHPAGIPVPHTAVIPERKDSFGETLGDFVQEHLLTRDAIVERVRTARPAARTAAWLADDANASRMAGHLLDASVTLVDLLKDDEVHKAIEEAALDRIDRTPLAPLAGKALEVATHDDHHQEVLDVVLRGVDNFLRDNRSNLRARFGSEAPWWLPETVEDRVFDRLVDGVHKVLHDVAANPNHELRRDFDTRVRHLASELQTSPELRARGEELKRDLLEQPELRQWTAAVWRDVKASLRAQADDPAAPLQRRLAIAIAAFGTRLSEDPALARRVDEAVENGARYVAEHFHHEIAAMVSGAIERWDGQEAATRLELLLGPDLQFIRINGTVVGGLAGLLIYAVSQAL